MAKPELLATIRDHYRASSKREKSRILDEFIAVTGHHRKHGIRLLGQSSDDGEQQPAAKKGRRIYDESVRQALIVVWEAADRICGKRLKAALPHLVESMERHGHLDLDPGVRQRLLAASTATLDRLLQPIRTPASRRLRRRRRQSPGRNIPVRTFADWNAPPPGFLEIDLVVHHGGSWWGSMIHSLVATDIGTGWTEAVPLLAREQSLVVAGLEAIGRQLPFPVKGIDSDNDSVFINDTLINDTLTQYCAERGIEFTRSRPYRKNDQAWIEQKNGAVVRHFVGHDRYSGSVAGPTMAHLYGAVRQYVNYFQPSFKLVEKTRHGSRVVKRYSPPATPCDRLMQHDAVSVEMKAALSEIGSSWTRWRCCTPSGKPSRPWPRLRSPQSGPLPAARAWNSSWPSCPTGGGRMQRIPHGSGGCNRPAPGELGPILSKECGATCWAGCRKTRTPVRWYCWADCKRLNRIVSAGLTCGRCSAGCSSGAASWPKSWSTPRLVSPWRDPLQCRN